MKITRRARCVMVIRFCLLLVFAQLVFLTIILVIAIENFQQREVKMVLQPDIRNATIFQGELVYPVWGSQALNAIDLKTGRVRELGSFRTTGGLYGVVTNGDRLWAIGRSEIFDTDGKTTVTHRLERLLDSKLPRNYPSPIPFLYEGNPAWIECDSTGNSHFCMFVDGVLEERDQVTFPDGGRTWKVDEQTGESVLVPEPAIERLDRRPVRNWCSVYVVPANETYYLFQVESNLAQIIYRTGINVATTPSNNDPVSALAPANISVDPSGWKHVDPNTLPETRWFWNVAPVTIKDEIYFVIDNQIFRFRPADKSSRLSRLEKVQFDKPYAPVAPALGQNNRAFLPRFNLDLEWGVVRLLSDTHTGDAYIVAATPSGEIDVFRVEGDRLEKLPFHIDGWGGPVIRYFAIASLPIVAVFLIGTVLLIFQAGWISSQTMPSSYSFSHDTVQLAPLERRSLARLIDLILILTPLFLQVGWNLLHTTGDTFLLLGAIATTQPAVLPRSLVPPLASSLWAGAMFLAFVTTTGLWGVTPGKWFCRVRVVRATLSPCGFARALMRELILWFDAPLLLTAIPGVVCQVVTQNRQRIGDLLADTIVIDVSTPK